MPNWGGYSEFYASLNYIKERSCLKIKEGEKKQHPLPSIPHRVSCPSWSPILAFQGVPLNLKVSGTAFTRAGLECCFLSIQSPSPGSFSTKTYSSRLPSLSPIHTNELTHMSQLCQHDFGKPMVSLYISQVGSLTTRIFYCLHSPFQEEKRKIQALDF